MNDARRQMILEELGLVFPWAAQPPAVSKAAESAMPATVDAQVDHPVRTADAPHRAAARPHLTSIPPVTAVAGDAPAQAREQAVSDMDWPALEAAVQACKLCGLCTTRSRTVFGVGARNADWMVVGEAPGAEEDRQGEPFVGQAGKLLDAMLSSVGRSRQENVFIANVLKCRPPGNRNPQPEEMSRCVPYLQRQIALIQPKLIFAVGRFAAQALLGSSAPIASLRGKVHQYQGIPLIVSYHPAYLLRNPLDKLKSWEDLLRAKKLLASATRSP